MQPIRGQEYIFYTSLFSGGTLLTNPTIAAGDFQVSKDGGAFGNLGTLPAVTPASGGAVKVTLSSSEMDAENVVVRAVDQAGAEWGDVLIPIQTIEDGIYRGSITGASPTTTTLVDTGLVSGQTDNYVNRIVLFLSGSLKGQIRLITGFTPASDTLTFEAATTAPAQGDRYEIL